MFDFLFGLSTAVAEGEAAVDAAAAVDPEAISPVASLLVTFGPLVLIFVVLNKNVLKFGEGRVRH